MGIQMKYKSFIDFDNDHLDYVWLFTFREANFTYKYYTNYNKFLKIIWHKGEGHVSSISGKQILRDAKDLKAANRIIIMNEHYFQNVLK